MKLQSLAISLAATIGLAAPAVAQTLERAPSATNETQAGIFIPDGTLVEILIAAPVSSRTAKRGDKFPITLAKPLVINGVLVAPAGATGEGEVITAAKAGLAGKPGELLIAARYITVDGQRIPLRASRLGTIGKDHSAAAMTAVIAIGVIGVVIKGGEIILTQGTPGNAKVAGDMRLLPPAPEIPAAPGAPTTTPIPAAAPAAS